MPGAEGLRSPELTMPELEISWASEEREELGDEEEEQKEEPEAEKEKEPADEREEEKQEQEEKEPEEEDELLLYETSIEIESFINLLCICNERIAP